MTMNRSPLTFGPGAGSTWDITGELKVRWNNKIDLIIAVANKTGIPMIDGENQDAHPAFANNRDDGTQHNTCTEVMAHEVTINQALTDLMDGHDVLHEMVGFFVPWCTPEGEFGEILTVVFGEGNPK